MIGAAIAVMAAERNEQLVLEQGQRAALILHCRIEASAERGGDVDRPASLYRAVGERQRENLVPRSVGAHDRRVEIERRALLVDRWRAGDAERRDISARQRGARDGKPQRALPDLSAAQRIERENVVVLGGDDQLVRVRSRPPPKQWLGIDLSLKIGMERRVEAQSARALVCKGGDSVSARAVQCIMIGEHGVGARGGHAHKRDSNEGVTHG